MRRSVGLGAGPLLGVIVGDPAIRLAYAVTGPALEQVTAAERQAAAGEVAVAMELLEDELGMESRRRNDTGALAVARTGDYHCRDFGVGS